MPLTLTWPDLLIRLGLSVLAGFLVGLNRGERKRPAGLRTTMLVCLAASLAMLQANQMLATAGKSTSSFVVLDLMRLPLGVLSGMGFIGAGTILRRGDMTVGVTTAATLWFVTVMGLCFGGGQIGLGLIALVLVLAILELLKRFEGRYLGNHGAILTIVKDDSGPADSEITSRIAAMHCKVSSTNLVYLRSPARTKLRIQLRCTTQNHTHAPDFVAQFAREAGVLKVVWKPL